MERFRIGVIVGSLSSTSINRRLAHGLMKLAPEGLDFTEISFSELPLYSQDYDVDFPPTARAWKAELAEMEALLFVTPEYNRSIPGGLKNAIDWASRPYGQNSFARKPCAVIGASTGAIGTAVAQQHLRSLLSFCNAPQMNSPEAYIHFRKDMFDDDDNVIDESTAGFLHKYMAEYRGFVERCYMALPRPDGKASQAG
jgi:chromate reductase